MMRQTRDFLRIFCFSLSLLLLFFACQDETPAGPEEIQYFGRGHVFNSESIATYTSDQIIQLSLIIGVQPEFNLIYDVQYLRLVYESVDSDGNPIQVSGALVIPVTDDSTPLLSINHGTVTRRDEVASEGPFASVEAVAGLWTASLGYITCIPDYEGFGISTQMHPYVHANSLSLSIIDLLRAAKTYLQSIEKTPTDQSYLSGYSEGGYATLAAQKEIEENYSDEFTITAVAPMAGPYDLVQTTEHIFTQNSYKSPAYIAFFLTAYNSIYGWNRLNDFFNSPYASQMTDLFDGSNTFSEINNQLPTTLQLLVKSEFISNLSAGNEPEIAAAITENTLLDWSPQAPIRFFHGDADETVPYFNATNAVDSLQNNGANSVELVTIAGGNHETSGLPAVTGMIAWFNQIRAAQNSSPAVNILASEQN
jgi:pimeloyl-ACP methyl ester carboxylesterase